MDKEHQRLKEFCEFHDLEEDVVKDLGFVKVSDGDRLVKTFVRDLEKWYFCDPQKEGCHSADWLSGAGRFAKVGHIIR